MRKNSQKPFMPVIVLFIVLNGFFIAAKGLLARYNFNQDVLIIGNAFLFVITLITFLMSRRSLQNPNPHAFVRAVYGSIIIKLFASMIVAMIYIFTFKKELNKPALFTVMGLYLVYTFLEVSVLTRLLKQPKDE